MLSGCGGLGGECGGLVVVLAGGQAVVEAAEEPAEEVALGGGVAVSGAAPVTRASGKTKSVTRRHIKNNRLAAAGYIWAFCALTASPGARAHYDRRKDAGDRHAAAQRNLFGRLLSCLHHCLATSQPYNENTAFPAPTPATQARAA